jgi:hypothetical protein
LFERTVLTKYIISISELIVIMTPITSSIPHDSHDIRSVNKLHPRRFTGSFCNLIVYINNIWTSPICWRTMSCAVSNRIVALCTNMIMRAATNKLLRQKYNTKNVRNSYTLCENTLTEQNDKTHAYWEEIIVPPKT